MWVKTLFSLLNALDTELILTHKVSFSFFAWRGILETSVKSLTVVCFLQLFSFLIARYTQVSEVTFVLCERC